MASRLEPEWRRQHQLIIDNYSESKGIVLAAGAAFGAIGSGKARGASGYRSSISNLF